VLILGGYQFKYQFNRADSDTDTDIDTLVAWTSLLLDEISQSDHHQPY